MNEKTIGERLRDLRKQHNMTQDDLANALGVSRVQINQWESGAREISNARIIKIADYFNTTCDYILLGKAASGDTNLQDDGNNFKSGFTDKNSVENNIPAKPKDQADEFPLKNILTESSLSALNDIEKMDLEKQKAVKDIINGLIGSKAFWNTLMPSAAAAYTVRKQTAMGGSIETIPSISDEMKEKLEDASTVIELGNSLGYLDTILISNEKAYKFQINEATDAFRNLLTAIIDQKAVPIDKTIAEWTEKYESTDNKNDLVKEFTDFLNQFGIKI